MVRSCFLIDKGEASSSDFWTPVKYLTTTFWAMSVGTIVAYGQDLVVSNPWKRMLLPATTEVVRVHVMVVVMPFVDGARVNRSYKITMRPKSTLPPSWLAPFQSHQRSSLRRPLRTVHCAFDMTNRVGVI